MDMIGKVKWMYFRDRISLSDIARRTGLSRNTVKQWVKVPTEVEPRYRRVAVVGKLSAFEQALEQMQLVDAGTSGEQPERCMLNSRLKGMKAATAG